jgi:membrane-associated protease RseP (regulator of RpoE activity)
VPLDRTVAMVNLDMVGRLGDGALHVGGVDSGTGLSAIVDAAVRAAGVRARVDGAPWAPSDHLRFYRAGTPVVFLSTRRHDDYHRPGDTADRIDADGLRRVTATALSIVRALADGAPPAWVALRQPTRERRPGQAFLGIVADGHAGDGVRVADVVPDSAAAQAGLEEGDVIARFAGRGVDRFDTLRRLIGDARPGDVIELVYLRAGEDRTAHATLGGRP